MATARSRALGYLGSCDAFFLQKNLKLCPARLRDVQPLTIRT